MQAAIVKWLGGIVVAALLLAGAYVQGRRDGTAVTKNKYVQAQKALAEASEKLVVAARLVDAQLLAANMVRHTEVKEIERAAVKIVERPGYRGQCIDVDGVQLVERSIGAANGRATAADGPDDVAARVRAGPDQH